MGRMHVWLVIWTAACGGGAATPSGPDGGVDAPESVTDSSSLDVSSDGARDGAATSDACVPAPEICGDRIDQNCNGRDQSCGDSDGDRYQACRVGDDLSQCDCDDDHATAYPGHPEECDALDNDCNGRTDEVAACCAGCAGVEPMTADLCLEDGRCDCAGAPGVGPCPSGLTCCAGGCVDRSVDADNCGFCGNRCGSTSDRCTAGVCRCGVGPPCDFIYTCSAGSC